MKWKKKHVHLKMYRFLRLITVRVVYNSWSSLNSSLDGARIPLFYLFVISRLFWRNYYCPVKFLTLACIIVPLWQFFPPLLIIQILSLQIFKENAREYSRVTSSNVDNKPSTNVMVPPGYTDRFVQRHSISLAAWHHRYLSKLNIHNWHWLWQNM